MVKTKKKYSRKEDIGTCRKCGKHFDDYEGKQHRKYICKECWNELSKKSQRKKASTLEGYFRLALNGIKNTPMRNRYENDVDLQFLMDLYKLQNGRCAISNIEMTWGYEDGEDERKVYRKPFNIGVDRIDGTKGYTKDNVILICNCVNFFKGNYDVELVYEVSKEIVKHENRLKEIRTNIENQLINV